MAEREMISPVLSSWIWARRVEMRIVWMGKEVEWMMLLEKSRLPSSWHCGTLALFV
jgi:hypothetical protein